MTGTISRVSLLACSLALATAVQAAPGDLDNNGVVGIPDVRLALRYAAGLAPSAAVDVTNGDVVEAKDGRITLADAARIARAASGLDPLGGGGGQGTIPMVKYDTYTVTGNGTKDIQLPGGYRISGTVKDAGGQPAGDGITFMQSLNPGAPGGSGSINETTGAYATSGVLPGTYGPFVTVSVEETDPGTGDPTYSYTLRQKTSPDVTVIDKDVVQNYVIGAFPGVATVSGAVTFGGPLAANLMFDSLNLFTQSGNTGGSGNSVSEDMVNYSVKVPPGQSTSYVSGSYFEEAGGLPLSATFDIQYMTPFTVTAPSTTKNFAITNLVAHRGTVTPPAGKLVGSVDYSNFNSSTTGDYYSSTFSYIPGLATPYVVAVAPGDYLREINLQRDFTDMTQPGFSYETTITVPAGGGTASPVTLPAVPAVFTITGKVTGPTGAAVQAYVGFTQSGTINNGYRASNYALTDATGNYSVKLPAGTYDVMAFSFG